MTKLKTCPTCGASYDAGHLFCPLDSAPLRAVGEPGELVGSLLAGRYLVSARIGVGGMGEVYRAQDVRLQRPVAIKVLHVSLSSDLDALARFSREAANCSKINNQHVVHVHDFGETEDGLAYIAMELVQGRSLKALIDAEAPLRPERVVRLVTQIANGLDAAHRLECPVVHRDLKPENVLVTQDSDGGEMVKVADFGISKALRDDTQHVTKTGFVTGTYEFMSPEQVTGGTVDQRSDVYTLGLIAFLMLTGKLPFPAQTPEHSMLLRLTEPPKTLSAMRPDLRWPRAVQDVIAKGLARDPGQRYDSAGGFAKDLARSLQPEPEVPLRKSKSVPRSRVRRPVLWAAGVLGLLGVGGGVVMLMTDRLTPRDTAFVQAPKDSRLVLADPVDHDSSPASLVPSAEPKQDLPAPPAGDTLGPRVHQPPTEPTLPSRLRPRSQPAQPTRPPVQPAEVGGTPLGEYEVILHHGLPRDSARLVLDSLEALIPRLRNARDSVEADLYRAEAMALAGEPDAACAVLNHARSRATDLQRRKIELWVDQGICAAQQSSVFPRRSRKVMLESLLGIRTISRG